MVKHYTCIIISFNSKYSDEELLISKRGGIKNVHLTVVEIERLDYIKTTLIMVSPPLHPAPSPDR